MFFARLENSEYVSTSSFFSAANNACRYSYDQPLVHTVMLSTEHDMAEGSNQYTWLEGDLSAVDRRVTPWLVVEMHRPMYSKSFVCAST